MRILKLSGIDVTNVVAKAISRKNDKLYYNITVGSKNPKYKFYCMYLSTKCFLPKTENDELELTGNDYIISPVKSNGENQKDSNGNNLYCIYNGGSSNYKSDIVLIWEIPNRNYTDIKYTLEGDVELLAEASDGKERSDISYISPIPILEIFGDCVLRWTGKDRFNNPVGQVVKYDYITGTWDNKL